MFDQAEKQAEMGAATLPLKVAVVWASLHCMPR